MQYKHATREKFQIRIDASDCASLAGDAKYFGRNYGWDSWRYRDLQFESGKIYGLVGEYGQGCMYLSYLLGGRIDPGGLKIYLNGRRIQRQELQRGSWNLEPMDQPYGKGTVKKSIEKAIEKNGLAISFAEIQDRFCLTTERERVKLANLSGERWRASAALGYVENKRIFYASYRSSDFYYAMCQSALLKVFRELTAAGALVLLPVGSDDLMKHIADECIDIKQDYDMDGLRRRYQELFGKGEWIR